MEIKAREGDFLETSENLIFDVKGFAHPPNKFIAYLRYYPDTNGKRIRNIKGEGIPYEKVYSLYKRSEFLKKNFPHYLFYDIIIGETLQGVSKDKVKKIYHPEDLVQKLLKDNTFNSKISEKAFELVKLIHSESGVSYDKIGITGSSLVNLETEQSDIDLIIYGSNNCYKVYETLPKIFNRYTDIIQKYSEKNILDLYEFRCRSS
ncbi:MAG TPA: hypothetical protein VMV49_04460, partial [Candidatus Deferrimicrobium sp.]|nr:hypothetical protein [Candidatus Deferrimicrobium sp.]